MATIAHCQADTGVTGFARLGLKIQKPSCHVCQEKNHKFTYLALVWGSSWCRLYLFLLKK